MIKLQLPPSVLDSSFSEIIEIETSLVVIGPNGSGKTKLGTWIEFESSHKDVVHRISAQKSLKMPEIIRTTSIEEAQSKLYYGDYRPELSERDRFRFKAERRWGRKPDIHLEFYIKGQTSSEEVHVLRSYP